MAKKMALLDRVVAGVMIAPANANCATIGEKAKVRAIQSESPLRLIN